MLADQLVRRGVRVGDHRSHAGQQQTRALGVQARTLEIYAKLGIVNRALELGKRGTGANLWAQAAVARVPIGEIRGEDHSSLHSHPRQDDNEKIIGDKLRRRVGAMGNRLVGLMQELNKVTAEMPDGSSRTITAAWVGMRRRAQLGTRVERHHLPGHPTSTSSTSPTRRRRHGSDEINVYLWQSGFHLLFLMRGKDHWRIVGILARICATGATSASTSPVCAMRRGRLSSRHVHGSPPHSHRSAALPGRAMLPVRRCRARSQSGRRAGHEHGLQDAWHSWKLVPASGRRVRRCSIPSRSASGRAAPARHHRLASGWWCPTATRRPDAPDPGRIAAFDGLERIREFAFRTVSQTGIHYPASSLSESLSGLPKGAPRAGDRFPWLRLKLRPSGPVEDLFEKLDDTQFNLIVIGQPAPVGLAPGLGDLRASMCFRRSGQ
jgi:hypothetical protein